MNNLQPNPSNAADDLVQPDWNSKHGTGTAPQADDSQDLGEIYERQREGAKERAEASKETREKLARGAKGGTKSE